VYCVSCGSRNPEYGKFCHNCGKELMRSQSDALEEVAQPVCTDTETDQLIRLVRTDPQPNCCHKCGATDVLTRHPFAFAKASVKREWGETVARLGLSAVSIVAAPVTGFGMFSWKGPNKVTSFRLISAELVLCRPCLQGAIIVSDSMKLKDDAYRCHPWAEGARPIGYDRFLSAEELSKLKPIRPKRPKTDDPVW